jgi:hypothetical protein
MSWTPSRYARRPSGTPCLACAASEAPVVTLVTACVRYLRCSVCGFIWTVRAPEAQAPTE